MKQSRNQQDNHSLILSGGRPILCVEDDLSQQRLLLHFLKRGGFACVAASNGREALDVLQRTTPCLILLDLEMPGMDGHEFLSQLRSKPEYKDLPVVVQTAHATRDNLVKFMKYGVRIALTKPLDERQLIDRVCGVLSEYRRLAEERAQRLS